MENGACTVLFPKLALIKECWLMLNPILHQWTGAFVEAIVKAAAFKEEEETHKETTSARSIPLQLTGAALQFC